MTDFKNAAELLALCKAENLKISEVMLRREIELGETTAEAANSRMLHAFEIMGESAHTPIHSAVKSMGGLIGGEAKKLMDFQNSQGGPCGEVIGKGITYAMAVLETNASMGLIVAAPTAGSAGIVPGVLLALQETYPFSDSQMVEALFNAGAIGYLAMRNATVAGAVGGCQAEVGVASAMAASAAVELLRYRMNAVILELHIDILLVAAVRTLILWTIITGLSQYRFLLIRSDHAYRYQQLILLISKLNSEIIWMHKNTAMIEAAMAKSYGLYSQLKAEDADPSLSQTALTVAKDIHEIKKEYQMILKGISEALELNLHDGEMTLSDIMRVLQNSVTTLAKEQGKQLNLQVNWDTNFKTDKHYFLLSVFRNLFTNAVEANSGQTVKLVFAAMQSGENYIFSVTDNGPGIPAENADKIFTPGFSTKINFHTGEVSRGLGLSLVEDIVKTQLQGHIRLESRPGENIFVITVPKAQLEV